MALLRMFRFLIDNSSSSHVDNRKNNFLVLSEGPSYGNDRSFGTLEEKFNINFSNARKKYCLTLHYNGGNSYFFYQRKIYLFKSLRPIKKNLNF